MPTATINSNSKTRMPPLDPEAVVPYSWDFSTWLGGETISEFEVAEDDGSLINIGNGVLQAVTSVGTVTPIDVAEDSGVVTAWIWGNETSGTAKLRCRVRTSGGRVDDRTMLIAIGNR